MPHPAASDSIKWRDTVAVVIFAARVATVPAAVPRIAASFPAAFRMEMKKLS